MTLFISGSATCLPNKYTERCKIENSVFRFLRASLFSFLLILLAASLLHTVGNFLKWRQATVYQSLQKERLKQLKQQRNTLKDQLNRLESDPLTQEALVRKIGYIKPNERVYRFVQKSP